MDDPLLHSQSHEFEDSSASCLARGHVTGQLTRRVVKVGGSLLTLPDLPDRLRRRFSGSQEPETLVVVGGGKLIEKIRRLDAVHHFDAETVHWKCVELLSATAARLSNLLNDWSFIETERQWKSYLDRMEQVIGPKSVHSANHAHSACTSTMSKSVRPTIVNVSAFYGPRLATKYPLKLPNSWATTSDSIAALLATIVNAQELVLLKSCPIPHVCSIQQAQHLEIIDDAFPASIEKSMTVRFENFRGDDR